MKRLSLLALLVPFAVMACAVGTNPSDSGETARDDASESSNISQTEDALKVKLDDSKYCLPGEVVHCTLGPPPVCTCVAKPVLINAVAW